VTFACTVGGGAPSNSRFMCLPLLCVCRVQAFVPFAPPADRQWNLTFWHRRFLYPIPTEMPEKRRIYWCKAPRNSGKGHLLEFLCTRSAFDEPLFAVSTPFRGYVDASLLLANMEKFAMRYADKAINEQPPGWVICDFPFETELTDVILRGLERLSDVGQPLEHGRFRGAEVCLRSHIIVFANVGPPEFLRERCLWLLEPASLVDQPAWQHPYLPAGHAAAAAAAAAGSAALPLPEDMAPLLVPAPLVGPVVAPIPCVIM
jgi:hypothetical protein